MIEPLNQTRKYLRYSALLSCVESASVKGMHINDRKTNKFETCLSLVVVLYIRQPIA